MRGPSTILFNVARYNYNIYYIIYIYISIQASDSTTSLRAIIIENTRVKKKLAAVRSCLKNSRIHAAFSNYLFLFLLEVGKIKLKIEGISIIILHKFIQKSFFSLLCS